MPYASAYSLWFPCTLVTSPIERAADERSRRSRFSHRETERDSDRDRHRQRCRQRQRGREVEREREKEPCVRLDALQTLSNTEKGCMKDLACLYVCDHEGMRACVYHTTPKQPGLSPCLSVQCRTACLLHRALILQPQRLVSAATQ